MFRDSIRNKKAVIFGAGKMACGLLGQLLYQSGFHTIFITRRPEVLNAINRWNGYFLDVGGNKEQRLNVRNCSALSINDHYRIVYDIAGADIVFTAVGIDNISTISHLIAEGLWLRSQTPEAAALNVIACENLPGTGDYLMHQIINSVVMKKTFVVDHIGGFSAGLTRRVMTGGYIENGKLHYSCDSDFGLIIDSRGLKGDFPDIKGVTFTNDFPVVVIRKLFTINCVQAIAAYLGYKEGCTYIHEAAVHPRIEPILINAMSEVKEALQAEFPHIAGNIEEEVSESLERIKMSRQPDTISRVARDPRRKISPRERLAGPVLLAKKHNLPYENLCHGIAAALSYDNPADDRAMILQEIIKKDGIEKILTEDCGFLPYEDIAQSVKRIWRGFKKYDDTPRHDLALVNGPLENIVKQLAAELNRQFESNLVDSTLSQVQKEFIHTPVQHFLPILIRKRVLEILKENKK